MELTLRPVTRLVRAHALSAAAATPSSDEAAWWATAGPARPARDAGGYPLAARVKCQCTDLPSLVPIATFAATGLVRRPLGPRHPTKGARHEERLRAERVDIRRCARGRSASGRGRGPARDATVRAWVPGGPRRVGQDRAGVEADVTTRTTSSPTSPLDPDHDYAYLANWGEPDCAAPETGGQNSPDAGVWVIDISDLERTRGEVGFIPSAGHPARRGHAGRRDRRPSASPATMLVMNNEPCGKNGKGGVSLWDVTNPLKPKKLSEHFGDRGALAGRRQRDPQRVRLGRRATSAYVGDDGQRRDHRRRHPRHHEPAAAAADRRAGPQHEFGVDAA